MTVAEDREMAEEEGLRETKYPHLRIATGGKGPPSSDGIGYNWLMDLETRSMFICRANDKSVDWEMYLLVFKSDDFCLLQWHLPDGKIWDRRVDPKLFSRQHRNHQVLAVYKQEPQEEAEGENDGNRDSDRTD